ncbi:tetrahydrofolate synthase [Segatella salivae]|uniref:tetrahydrofolate synthase n=1 Tax=Segatella salivae TaxID=228604 RepID=UPI0028E2C152|nr:tetrahydrofolate synthase [Segatella salivae]
MEILSLRPLFLLKRDGIKKAQRRRYYASVSMSESIITNIATMQRRRFYANILMNESTMTNVITTQRRRCCSFDSPGLARNEPTLGKHSQGDSTP